MSVTQAPLRNPFEIRRVPTFPVSTSTPVRGPGPLVRVGIPPVGGDQVDKSQRPQQQAVSSTRHALRELGTAFGHLREAIDLDAFNPHEMAKYITAYEQRTGQLIDAGRREQLMQLAFSRNPQILQMIALELRIGFTKRTKKAERRAMMALGRLVLERDNIDELKAFLEDPEADDNVKAYVQTLVMMNQVETAVSRYQRLRERVRKLFSFKRDRAAGLSAPAPDGPTPAQLEVRRMLELMES